MVQKCQILIQKGMPLPGLGQESLPQTNCRHFWKKQNVDDELYGELPENMQVYDESEIDTLFQTDTANNDK